MNADLQAWIARFGSDNLPGFALTAKHLAEWTDDDSAAKAIADVVLPDAAMTARVLKLANSVYYNPGLRPISNLQSACVVLGVKVVRNLVLTARTLIAGDQFAFAEQFRREVSYSFHMAMQAQAIARLMGLRNHETVYIAALLARIGHWLFWSSPQGYGERMQAYIASGASGADIERELLGFGLHQLSDGLLRDWKLTPLASMLPTKAHDQSEEQQCIASAMRVAEALKQGWKSAVFEETVQALVRVCRISKNDMRAALLACVEETRATLKQLNIDRRHWPPLEGELPNASDDSNSLLQRALARDVQAQKQGRHLRLLTHMLCAKVELPRFMRCMLEGLRKGVAFDNVFVIMPHPKTHEWRVTGHDGEHSLEMANAVVGHIQQDSRIAAKDHSERHSLAAELVAGRICWPPINPRIAGEYTALFGSEHYCVFPLRIANKTLGYVGAAKTASEGMTEDDFEVFCHFCDHAVVAIKLSLLDAGVALPNT